MTTPAPRNHTEKPPTPPTGPSGVSRDLTADQMRNAVRDVIGGTLRQLYALLGGGDEPPPQPAVAPHHLEAMSQAYEEGYDEGDRSGAVPHNPYRKMLDDRREFIREAVNESLGYTIDEDGVDVLGDENTEWFDAVLDAHDEWLALQQRKATS